MRQMILRTAFAIVRFWTRLYTSGLPEALREARREEIESDLWEAERASRSDPAWSSALQAIVRLAAGIPDDLGWRMEQVNAMARMTRVSALVAFAGASLAIWVGIASWMTRPAPLPAPSLRPLRARMTYPPPPSPPAPPPRSHFDKSTPKITFNYAETSYATAGNIPLPIKVKDVRPIHAPIAVAAGVNGTVLIEATIDEAGRVADPRILQSVPMLDQSAVDALRQWEFEPTSVKGEAIPVTIRVTVNYRAR